MVADQASSARMRPLDRVCAALRTFAESELGNGRFGAP